MRTRRRRTRHTVILLVLLLLCGSVYALIARDVTHDDQRVAGRSTAPADVVTSTSPVAPFRGVGNARSVGLAGQGLTCDSLPAYTGPEQVTARTVLSRQRFEAPLDLSAGGITITQSCFRPTSVGRGLPAVSTTDHNSGRMATSTVTIRESDFDGSLLDPETAAFSTGFIGVANLTDNYVSGFGSGLAIMGSGEQLDARVEGNYVTGLVAWGDGATTGNHSSAFTVRDFSGAVRPDRALVVRGNRFDSSSGNDTGAVFIQTFSGRIDNVLLEANLLEGLGYQFGLEETNHPYSGIHVVDNRATGTGWGPAYVSGGPGPARWVDNRLYDPTADAGRGEAIPAP
ncbi:hypothetical protein [Ornithinimicrobium pekingense]|uniref:hypothetical protein n=1 Tax=Ornithinimicrobium pekingense TaxID=384677 RepID=UPI0012EBF531|nr:hypothetical protein [Ornithinimicrobium pekingense]